MRMCINCFCLLSKKQAKFCSNQCQSDHQYHAYIENWKSGKVDGKRSASFLSVSRHIKRYLMEKGGEQCSLCQWKKRHPKTNNVPLEVDHIDGDPNNNQPNNLQLVCPNCHSLTPFFRNLNKGRGRSARRHSL